MRPERKETTHKVMQSIIKKLTHKHTDNAVLHFVLLFRIVSLHTVRLKVFSELITPPSGHVLSLYYSIFD